jgi:hypothetical protein
LGITYNKNGNPNLEAFSDSDWGTFVKDKRLSRTGVILDTAYVHANNRMGKLFGLAKSKNFG